MKLHMFRFLSKYCLWAKSGDDYRKREREQYRRKKTPEYAFVMINGQKKLPWVKKSAMYNLCRNRQLLLKIQKHKTSRYRDSFRFSAAKIRKDLPFPLRYGMSTESF